MSVTYSYINNAHPSYIENLYQQYLQQADSVELAWQKFFEGFDYAMDTYKLDAQKPVVSEAAANGKVSHSSGDISNTLYSELNVYRLISAYRQRGHLVSKTNPIKKRRDRKANLELHHFKLSESDLTKEFHAGNLIGLGKTSLQNIEQKLKDVYTRSLGFEYNHITDSEQLKWFRTQIETLEGGNFDFDNNRKKQILEKINEAVVFEEFLGKKYVGQKRFSLEGGESAIPALDAIINKAAETGTEEVVIGMAHRGRLNVLVNIMGKTYAQVLNEFEGTVIENEDMTGDGDVKYHLGHSSQITAQDGNKVYLKLLPNPSHLESIDPVVQGFTRAKADAIYNSNYDKILPILIHGDAAVAGQGVVYEVAQMSKLEGYEVGGIIHFVINNQIGFTTDFDDARSSDYCTSVAYIVKAPVIHVNGDDVEAVVFAAELAAMYRKKFNSDIYIDMVCYRKYGHNEGDDPSYTQPDMYQRIKKHPNPKKIYADKLIQNKEVPAELVAKMEQDFFDFLQDRLDEVRQQPLPYVPQELEKDWDNLREAIKSDFDQSPPTGISSEKVGQIVKGLIRVPEGFEPLRKVNKMLEKRRKIMKDNNSLDWAAAELLAYGSILLEGNDVRMSGEDVKRGTFSHRHAMIYDQKTYEEYNRLSALGENQGRFRMYNSLLSEYAVLGFEFGYAFASPHTLTIWEAQFGDFVNGAQIILDQYISSTESKWNWMNGIVLLLPHGYAGQGPEHSSARLERFLQACAEKNMYVVNITEPANFFHVLRRQQHLPFRKPLIVMSPKSLLRHPKCTSDIHDVIGEDKRFQEFIDDPFIENKEHVRKILLCSGKIYYDLAAKQATENIQDVAIIRIEQLYPLAYKRIKQIIATYPSSAKRVWVQEEPANMGAWWHINFRLRRLLNIEPFAITRKTSASPATGYKKQHEKEQIDIIRKAFQ